MTNPRVSRVEGVSCAMRWAAIAAAVLLATSAPRAVRALDLSENPERSFFFGFGLGAGLDLERDARRATDGREAFSVAGFLFGIGGGFRFNEIAGIEAGLSQCRHAALKEWGGAAGYTLGRVALRLAVPTPSRQTIVFKLGPTIGSFFYGAVDGLEENEALVVGGLGGIALEHELSAALVTVFDVGYMPLWRRGQHLYLSESGTPDSPVVQVDEIDFGEPRVVHVLWMSVGLQFEGVIP
jgi:hypothetical protein